jgi:hypothetical protein
MRNIAINQSSTIFKRTRQFTAYADNAATIDRSVGALNEVLPQLQLLLSTGLVINTGKTKQMKLKKP